MMPSMKWIASVAAALVVSQCFAGNLELNQNQISAKGLATVSCADGVLRLEFDDPTHDSGLSLIPPQGQSTWDFSTWKYLAVDVENLSADKQMRLLMELATEGSEKKQNRDFNVGIALNPGEKRTMRMLLPHQWKYGAPEGVPGIRTLDTAHINRFKFFVQWPFEVPEKGLVNCRLSNLRLEEPLTPTAPMTAEQYIPFMDEYGQFIHRDWPAKVHSAADLRRNYVKEKAELDAATPPEEWDRYGGWKNGPQLKATGSFRTEKYQGKWYFVDPDGRLFISQGLDVLSRYNDSLKVMPGKENWFQTLPEGAKAYFPTELALRQKYGTENYLPEYISNLHKRLVKWGINTIGDWGTPDLMELDKTPYTLQLTDFDWKMPRLGSSKVKFYDVFDPAYINKMKNLVAIAAKKDPIVEKSLTDPMCIGYFIDNELNFGNRGKLILIDEILKCPAKQASKQVLVNEMKLKYGQIGQLNSSWGTDYADWDALLASTKVPEAEGYREDAKLFFEKVVDQYFRLAREAVKSVAPNRLYLGCRFISTDAPRMVLCDAAKKYCDVLTVNIYAHSAANFPVEKFPDMPVLIGEFQFGVLDRGMFSGSLCQAGTSQADRAMAYTRFWQGVLAHPNFVGAHWFQYRDQPLTGRGDGEAYQIGFVDVADTPYEEITQAARLIGEHMYRYRTNGKLTNSMAGQE